MGHVARFVFPSIADLFFLALFWALLAAAFRLGLSPMQTSDGTFAPGSKFSIQSPFLTSIRFHRPWKVRTGLRGNGCTTWQLASLDRAFGLNGVVWLCALIIATTFACVVSYHNHSWNKLVHRSAPDPAGGLSVHDSFFCPSAHSELAICVVLVFIARPMGTGCDQDENDLLAASAHGPVGQPARGICAWIGGGGLFLVGASD